MFATHNEMRFDMPKGLFGPDEFHWSAVSFETNSYVFLITYVERTEDDSFTSNLMVASTELLKSCVGTLNRDVLQLTLLASPENRLPGWSTYTIATLEADGSARKSADEVVFDTLRLTTVDGEILYLAGDCVTRESQEADFVPVFALNLAYQK